MRPSEVKEVISRDEWLDLRRKMLCGGKKRKVLVPSSFPQSCFIIPLSLAVEKKSWKREKARRIFGKESW